MTRLAKITGAAVVPFVTRQRPGGAGYAATFHPAWQDFPSDDVEAEVLKMPEQYYWLHKRCKTRPPGEKGVY